MKFKGRFFLLYLLFALFIAVSTITRTTLLIKALPNLDISLIILIKIYAVGFFYDAVTFTYFVIPYALYAILVPDRIFLSRYHKPLVYLVFLLTAYLLLFGAVAEYLFFDEFGVRFNFIAIDYLVYTHEVIGNIKESYPVNWIFGTILAASILVLLLIKKFINQSIGKATPFTYRIKTAPLFIVLPFLSYALVDLSFANISQNSYASELAGNGIYHLGAAFRNNELNYKKFYATKDTKLVLTQLRDLLKEKNNTFQTPDLLDITREIKNRGLEKKLNVIVIVEESLSAEYLGAFGNTQGLTPNLDKLAGQSLNFTHIYATGTRTVRGLEAITLSIPSMPGTSIIKRPGNENFFSWGSIMKERGYDNKFIYGGFGYFDNMNHFFAGNGFEVIDRNVMNKDEITFANIWGICDEDLFRRVITEAGKSYEHKKPFFSVVMTTSNHRPFTYPDGKIDIPSHTGRPGGVKYADHALGRFIDEAQKQPWFRDTIFVIVADHCAGSAGKTELPVKKYEIPLLIYAPSHIQHQRIDTMASQIDIAPTVLGLLNFSYTTKFFGKDILKMDAGDERAFITTYQKLGFIKDNKLVILGPKKKVNIFRFDRSDGRVEVIQPDNEYINNAISYYQGTQYIYDNRLNRLD